MKSIINSSLLTVLFLSIYSCSPKVKQVVDTPLPPVIVDTIITNPNCITFRDLSPNDLETAETAYVLYRDELKAKKYNDAKYLWKIAFDLAPAANGKVKYQYDDGIKIYQALYQNSTDSILKNLYIDTIMSIYDKRLECQKDTSYVMGRKAYDYYYTYPGTKSNDKLFQMMTSALDRKGKKADYFIINPLTQLLIEQYKDKKIDKPTAKKYTYKILDAIQYGKAHCKRDCEAWKIVGDYAPLRLEAFEALSDFYECEYYVEHYYHEFEADSTDCEIINRTYAKLKRGHCDENGEQFEKLAKAKAKHCKVIATPAGPCRAGYTAYTDGQFKNAISSFEECIESITDNDKKAKYQLLIAKIYYRDLKNFPKARKHARIAAQLKANWGEPYMLIGRLYASSGPLCGSGRGFESQKVVWPAIDKWKHAKKIDPMVAKDANKLINTYKQYMPSKEDLHQRTLTVGTQFKVTCWINEYTIIRSAD